MFPKWDAVVLAAALMGGSVMIESSHRVDTGAPDDEVAAASTTACEDAEAYQMSGMRRGTVVYSDEGFVVSDTTDTAAQSSCE